MISGSFCSIVLLLMLVISPGQALLQLISSLMVTTSLLAWSALSLKVLLGVSAAFFFA